MDETDHVGPDSLQEITPQGTIVVNANVDVDVLEHRKINIMQAKPNEVIIGQFSVDAQALTARPMQIAMMSKDEQYIGDAKTTHKITVFTSFAGVRVNRSLTQRRWERSYRPVGFVMKLADASNVSPPVSGISVKKGGSGTTINSSGTTLMPGDVFGARLPAIDEDERSLQYQSESARRPPHSRPRGTFGATIKKITYKDIVGEFHEIAQHFIKNNSNINLPLIRKMPSKALAVGDEYDQEAACLKKYNAAAFLSGVQAVLESGLVVPTVSSTTVDNLAFKWEAARAPIIADPNNVNAIYEHVWLPGPANDVELNAAVAAIERDIATAGGAAAGGVPAVTTAIKTALTNLSQNWSGRFVPIGASNPAIKMQRENSYRQVVANLGIKFGLAFDAGSFATNAMTTDMNDENYGMTLSANVRLLVGSIGDSFTTLQRETLAEHVKKDLPFDRQVRRDSFGTPVSSDDSVADQILKSYYEAGSEWVKLCGRSFDNAMRMAMGTVLNYSRPNNALHYSLT